MWAAVYARVITATGWTWEYLDDNVTIPRLTALTAHWRDTPPAHEALASILIALGVTRAPAAPAGIDTPADDSLAFFRDFAGAGGRVALPAGATA